MSVTKPTDIEIKGPDGVCKFRIEPDNELMTIKIGKSKRRFSKTDIWGLAFIIANEEQQDKMIFNKKTEMVKYQKKHSVRLRHDMKAGECVNIICDVDVEKSVADGMEKALSTAPEVVKIN